MNTNPPVDTLICNLPTHDINFPTPIGLTQVSSSNLDIDKFYYQCWSYGHANSWQIVRVYEEGYVPSCIYTELMYSFNPTEFGYHDDINEILGSSPQPTRIFFAHLKTEFVEPGNLIPDSDSENINYFRYYTPVL